MERSYQKRMVSGLIGCCTIACLAWFIGILMIKGTMGHPSVKEEINSPVGLDYDPAWTAELKAESAILGKPAVEVLCMRWDSRQVSADFTERTRVAAFVGEIPVEGREMLTGHQLDLLRDSIAELLFCNGTNDRESYYRYLLNSGETLCTDGRAGIQSLAAERNMPDVLKMQSLQQLVWYGREKNLKPGWYGLVAEGTRMRVFEARTEVLPDPALAIRKVIPLSEWYIRRTAPPKSREEIMKARGGNVLVVDLEVYIADDRHCVRPYYCRYWFDSENSIWRLEVVLRYVVLGDRFGCIVS